MIGSKKVPHRWRKEKMGVPKRTLDISSTCIYKSIRRWFDEGHCDNIYRYFSVLGDMIYKDKIGQEASRARSDPK